MEIKHDKNAEVEDFIKAVKSYIVDLGYSENTGDEYQPVAKTYMQINNPNNQYAFCYQISIDGEYLDDVVVEIDRFYIGQGCHYHIISKDEQHYYGQCVEEMQKDLAQVF